MSARDRFLGDLVSLEKVNFSLAHGFRAAVIVVAPLVVGLATGQPEYVFATLGAMFVTNTEGPNAAYLPLGFLLLACFTESAALALGTLAGLTGLLAVPLVGAGVFVALATGGNQKLAQVGKFTAIFYAVGVGLPGGSVAGAEQRLWLSLFGGVLALVGAAVHRALTAKRAAPAATGNPEPIESRLRQDVMLLWPTGLTLRSDSFRNAVAVGLASSLGLIVGLALGLPRDFWIVITIILAARLKFGPTVTSSSMMVIGTIAGAAIAGSITIGVTNDYALEILLLLFATCMFATRGVNLGLTQVFFSPFIIILLNILYPGEWYLAEIRILDVAIGGAIAVGTVYLLRVITTIDDRHKSEDARRTDQTRRGAG